MVVRGADWRFYLGALKVFDKLINDGSRAIVDRVGGPFIVLARNYVDKKLLHSSNEWNGNANKVYMCRDDESSRGAVNLF